MISFFKTSCNIQGTLISLIYPIFDKGVSYNVISTVEMYSDNSIFSDFSLNFSFLFVAMSGFFYVIHCVNKHIKKIKNIDR